MDQQAPSLIDWEAFDRQLKERLPERVIHTQHFRALVEELLGVLPPLSCTQVVAKFEGKNFRGMRSVYDIGVHLRIEEEGMNTFVVTCKFGPTEAVILTFETTTNVHICKDTLLTAKLRTELPFGARKWQGMRGAIDTVIEGVRQEFRQRGVQDTTMGIVLCLWVMANKPRFQGSSGYTAFRRDKVTSILMQASPDLFPSEEEVDEALEETLERKYISRRTTPERLPAVGLNSRGHELAAPKKIAA